MSRVPQLPYPADLTTAKKQGEYIKALYKVLQEYMTIRPGDFDIKLDDWLSPDDNTDLDSSTTAHGLLPKLDNTATNFLNGTGAWSIPAPSALSDPATIGTLTMGSGSITDGSGSISFGDEILSTTGNIGIGTATFGTSADQSFGIAIGTEPGSSIAGQVEIYAKDSSDGSTNATLGLRSEQGVESIGTFTASHKLKMWINGVEYWISLDQV